LASSSAALEAICSNQEASGVQDGVEVIVLALVQSLLQLQRRFIFGVIQKLQLLACMLGVLLLCTAQCSQHLVF
jgi:hypothetical protein